MKPKTENIIIKVYFILAIIVLLNLDYAKIRKQIRIINFDSSIYFKSIKKAYQKKKDTLILSSKDIENLNNKAIKKGYVFPPLKEKSIVSGAYIKKRIKANLNYLKVAGKYDFDNNFIPKSRRLKGFYRNCNIEKIKRKVKIKYGIVVKSAFLRLAPSYEYRMKERDDYFFDILQISFVQIGDIVVILHSSRDGNWYFVRTYYAYGWISKRHISVTDRKRIEKYLKKPKIIVIAAETKIYFNKCNYDKIYMGQKLHYSYKKDGKYYIKIPYQEKDFLILYIKKDAKVSESYLKFTVGNFLKQVKKMLDKPYAWGEYNGSVDCSALFVRLYKCFGLYIPRGSVSQISFFNTIKLKGDINTKLKKIKKLKPMRTFLYKQGHIMLYMGTFLGKPLIFHTPWKYYTKDNTKVIIGKTVISDVYLGAGSKEGSYLKQIYKAATF